MSRRGGSRALGAAIVLAAALAAAPAGAADEMVQPGGRVGSSVGQCTLNFVFTDATSTYIGTAAHCVAIDERVRDGAGSEFGTVVFDDSGVDFALILVDAGRAVNPAVRYWGGPTGATAFGETSRGDVLLEYGYGIVFGTTSTTRPRVGILMGDDADDYTANTGAVNGDSGAPLLHRASGKALGIISRYNLGEVPPSTDAGPTVERILARLSQEGFAVEIATAPLAPPSIP